MKRIFHIDLDAFFVSVERVRNPQLIGKPVCVGGGPGKRGVVTCASYEARPYGLKAGMPTAQAMRLCPQAIFIPGDFSLYQQVSERFMEILASFTPFLEPLSLDEAYLDMTGFECLYGSATEASKAIKQKVRDELHIVASVGIASSKVAAKVASSAGKPDGLVEVPPGQDAAYIAPLPLDDLPGVGEKSANKLEQLLGIKTVGDLAQVTPIMLRKLFGAWGDVLHLLANGRNVSPVAARILPKSISRETTFSRDVADDRIVLRTMRYLAEDVGRELRQYKLKARCVVLKLRFADFTTISRHATVREYTSHNEAIFETGAGLLHRQMTINKQSVRLIGVGVSQLKPNPQQMCFIEGDSQRMERLSLALDILRRKYGYQSIQTGYTLMLTRSSSYLPELVSSFTRPRPDTSLLAPAG
jgi:DNA polymerase-4